MGVCSSIGSIGIVEGGWWAERLVREVLDSLQDSTGQDRTRAKEREREMGQHK